VPDEPRHGRPSWILATALFAAALITTGALAQGLQSPAVALTGGVVAQPTAGDIPSGRPIAGPTTPPATPAPRRYLATPPPGPAPTPTPKAVPTPAPVQELSGYRWPLRGRLTLGFMKTGWGSRIVDGERFHDGIDIATGCGDRIVAAHSGVVLAAGRRFDDHVGWIGDLTPYYDRLDSKQLWSTLPIVIVIDDGNGYRSIYAHFSKVTVKKGQRVKAGQLIGYEGDTGRASGCHLHYGLFSPYETARFGLHPDSAKRMKLPRWEIARIDPLRVLPYRRGISPSTAPGAPDQD
jgi:murein DD-endopeptidase MepM/ murein hydrolase activator NlpD